LLERVALSNLRVRKPQPIVVNLLTLHSPRASSSRGFYIVGVEDYRDPGYQAATNNVKDEIEEAHLALRRDDTRACDRLILTRCERAIGPGCRRDDVSEEMGSLHHPKALICFVICAK